MSNAPWLDGTLQRFSARLGRGQTPQALLIYGPAGLGRRHFALTIAAQLLGSDWRPDLDTPADLLGGVPHPDFWSVGLDEESRVITVDQIRELNQALNLTSHRRGWKVGLVWPAGAMNHNAANTLLKTLEEPPAATTVVLIADALSQLPATIISRCERIRLSPPTSAVSIEWLARRHADRSACGQALAFTSGAPLAAYSLLREEGGAGVGKTLAELGVELRQLVDRSVPPTTLARAWARRDAGVCLRWLYLQTAALMRRQVRAPGEPESALLPLIIPTGPVNMAACSAYLAQVMEAQRLKDRSLNMEAIFAELLMWWYGAVGAAR